MTGPTPTPCPICGRAAQRRDAGFRTDYNQHYAPAIRLTWHECEGCHACFVHPLPAVSCIQSFWRTVAWGDPRDDSVIFHRKLESHKRMLELCETGAGPRTLLDFGSNFGGFMELAKEAGWETVGVEPSEEAATTSRKKGLDVRCAWSLEVAALSDGCFGAIVANDVFYYVWEPFLTLRKCYALLAPGGCLAMRISNKRMWLTAARMVLPAGRRRTAIANRLLRGEFHTISSTKLGDVLRSVGFEQVQVFGRAATAPLKECGLLTKLAYIGADVVWTLSAHNLNLYPGVYVVAQKPVSPRGTGELLLQGGSTRPLVLP